MPFHMWAPDVYDGSPDAGHRLHGHRGQGGGVRWRWPGSCSRRSRRRIEPVAAGGRRPRASRSMVVGNLVALAQRSLKRMLAYSSIAHAGYLLAALWPGTRLGAGAVLLYLAAYGLTTLASFGIPGRAGPGRGAGRDL